MSCMPHDSWSQTGGRGQDRDFPQTLLAHRHISIRSTHQNIRHDDRHKQQTSESPAEMNITLSVFLFCSVMPLLTIAANQDDYYLCLHNCALCVRLWEPGVYDGEKCANNCTKNKSNPQIVDPDCKSLKMFNYRAMERVSSEREARGSSE